MQGIVRQNGARCDELDGSVPGQVQLLCWMHEGAGFRWSDLCVEVTTCP